MGGTPLVPQQKSAKKNCLDLRLDEPWSTQTSGALSLALASAGSVDSLLLSWELFFESGKGWSGESLQALPARSHNLAAGDSVDLRWSCNSQRLWFEVPKLSLFTTAPLPRVFLLDWYAEMLNDASRNIAFARGIHQAIGKGGRVVDLGCGCGLLARLALRQNATEALAVEIAPHLARLAQRLLPEAKVICGDIRAVMVDEDQRFDLVVAELLDAGGLGEKIVPFLRHAKSRLLRPGGRCLPRSLRLRAALLDLRLSREGHGLDLSAWEPFWVPARASSGEWLGIDLDAGADWQPVSDVVDLFNLNFEASQGELIEALQEQEIDFKLFPDARRCNAVAWWFEADLGIGELGSCDLTSAPSRFRPASCEPTHWVQAVAGLGPFDHFTGERHLLMRVRTDGVQITWTPLNAPVPQEDHSFVAAWRQETAEVDQQLRDLERHLTTGGDLARLAAVKSAALMLAAQPNRFGLEATPEVVTRLLKALFV
ncbi:Protein arginine N-methyltransferase 7 (Histone-arginine N-methyltransferase PRMT7) ([Myelin basic protein]-arginine N-methyltransferase PRMT7) [Durusdinium trenchii]|uniref:Protein arginine N-methyltransferase 7 (Histone-arginine N-methyltransferase PRMT7) ([Myelin basic protein]-arginine N-methyltransferase PRMT7) n=1 Tax=Durusdinium trenchii TaxID=1381693 RepID=A0ABP0IZ44_9DINO